MEDSSLFVEERHALIVDYLETHTKAAVGELCKHFGVSGATMRNDLRALEERRLITRTHGGAMKRTRTGLELDSLAKEVQNRRAKQVIARQALNLVENGDTIVLDTGTTTLELAHLLGERRDLTVVTNDLAIALALESFEAVSIVLLGGSVRKRFHCTVSDGTQSDSLVSDLTVDKAFMGTNSLSVAHGASTPDLSTAHVKRAMIAMAATVIMLADATKLDRTSFARFATIDQIDVLVTDTRREPVCTEISECGVELICADESPSE